MDSSYSAISKNSYVELQKQTKLLPPDEESFVNNNNNNGVVLADDLDPDAGSNQGSGISGAVFNLTTSIIGAGIMALPATMKVLGLFLGLLLIVLIAILSEISVELLVRFSSLYKSRSYGEVVQFALGKPARVLSEVCIVVNNGGFLVVYLIIMGDVMSGSLHHVGVLDQWLGNGFWDHRKVLILVVVVVFLAPLCALNKIDSLSVTSAASVALAVVFVVVCFIVAAVKVVEGSVDAPRMSPDFGSKEAVLDLLVVIPIMTNAYVCHFNVQPIYNELEGRTPEKMNRVGRVTTGVCVVVYASTAVSGYLLFGKDTESDVLTNFDQDLGIRFSSAVNYIVRVGYILHLVLVFPVIHFSLRETVDTLLFEGSPPLCESKKRSLGLTVILLALIYIGSTMIPNIWTAFKFTGATSAVSLGFTFPALIALRLGKQSNSLSGVERSVSWLMLILAVVVSVVGTLGNIYSLRSKSD
ncbi:unnamed protein product [Brassica napus]|uniref:(rape) hypothetical protein n=1 Tax=Brassica napus TaxID=3708 RepID=A0A816YZR1_BRANA|nr:unnamed protein product [Brassica napus]